jgi:hypothetical protein
MSMRFDKEDIAKASTSSLVLVVTVDMLSAVLGPASGREPGQAEPK